MTSVLALLAIGIAAVSLAFLMGRWESNDSMAGAAAACAVFVLVVFAVAASEVAVGLALIISIYRRRHTIAVEEIDMMKW